MTSDPDHVRQEITTVRGEDAADDTGRADAAVPVLASTPA